jgi:hypothetical protein
MDADVLAGETAQRPIAVEQPRRVAGDLGQQLEEGGQEGTEELLAALRNAVLSAPKEGARGIILTGGNVDLDALPWIAGRT